MANQQVVSQSGIRNAERRRYRQALQIVETQSNLLQLNPSMGGGEFAIETFEFKKVQSAPPPVLAFDDFGTPPVLISTALPSLGLLGFDAFYGGYPITSYAQHTSLREGVEVEYFIPIPFGNPTISYYVLRDKSRKNPAQNIV